jgi:hypothetical protein
MRQQDMEMVRKMLSEELVYSCERCFQDSNYVQRIPEDQLDALYSTAYWLVMVACSVLKLRSTQGGSELWPGLDADVILIVKLVGPVLMFNQLHAPQPTLNPLHMKTFNEPVRDVGDGQQLMFATWWYWEQEPSSWLTPLLEHFGQGGGLKAMMQVRPQQQHQQPQPQQQCDLLQHLPVHVVQGGSTCPVSGRGVKEPHLHTTSHVGTTLVSKQTPVHACTPPPSVNRPACKQYTWFGAAVYRCMLLLQGANISQPC